MSPSDYELSVVVCFKILAKKPLLSWEIKQERVQSDIATLMASIHDPEAHSMLDFK